MESKLNRIEDLMDRLIYTHDLFNSLKEDLEVLSEDEKLKFITDNEGFSLHLSDHIKANLAEILKANLKTYSRLITLYYDHPDQYYVVESAWKNKINVNVIARIDDEDLREKEILKHINFHQPEHKEFMLLVLQELPAQNVSMFQSYLEKIKAWAKDPALQELAAFASLTILTANSILRSLHFSDIRSSITNMIGSLFGSVKELFSLKTMAKFANASESELIYLFEGLPAPQNCLERHLTRLKSWIKNIPECFKNIKNPIALKAMKDGLSKSLTFMSWTNMLADISNNIQVHSFFKQAREALTEKNQQLDDIEKQLKKIEAYIELPFSAENALNISSALKNLQDISNQLTQINEFIEKQIAEAETLKKTREIATAVTAVTSIGGAIGGAYLGGLLDILGKGGLLLGTCMIAWNVSNIQDLKNLIKDYKETKVRLDDVVKETQSLITELIEQLNQVESGLI